MGVNREELLSSARAEREALGRTVQYVPAALLEAPSPCQGWTVTDVLAHLGAQEAAAAALIADETPEAFEAYRSTREGAAAFDLDAYNEAMVAERRTWSFRDVINEWGSAADRLLVTASKIPVEEWDDRVLTWLDGTEVSVADLVQSRVAEWWLHGEDVRAGGERAARTEPRPIWLLNDLAIRRLPLSLAETGSEYWGLSVKVTLEGPGGGTWHQRLAAGPAPDDSKNADVSIDARGQAFALLAGRRISADPLLANGQLLLGGNDLVGYDILEHIRPYL